MNFGGSNFEPGQPVPMMMVPTSMYNPAPRGARTEEESMKDTIRNLGSQIKQLRDSQQSHNSQRFEQSQQMQQIQHLQQQLQQLQQSQQSQQRAQQTQRTQQMQQSQVSQQMQQLQSQLLQLQEQQRQDANRKIQQPGVDQSQLENHMRLIQQIQELQNTCNGNHLNLQKEQMRLKHQLDIQQEKIESLKAENKSLKRKLEDTCTKDYVREKVDKLAKKLDNFQPANNAPPPPPPTRRGIDKNILQTELGDQKQEQRGKPFGHGLISSVI